MERTKPRLPLVTEELAEIDAAANGLLPERIARAIRARTWTSDTSFDRFLPDELRRASARHWTPIAVALRVARWLNRAGVQSVVDIGSGAGKFCVVAALASRCSFIGIEQRPRLVEAARGLATTFGVGDQVAFVNATLSLADVPAADAYYFYNPFGENLFGADEKLGDDVELGLERYERDVALVEAFLCQVPAGTIVVAYNGFGGQMPRSFDEVIYDREIAQVLRMWRKRPDGSGWKRARRRSPR